MSGLSLHKKNCFDITRHFAALLVIYSHHHAFNNLPEGNFFGIMSLGGLGVAIFFSISGYLVTQSFGRCINFYDFMEKRARRIFPALIVCSFILIFLLAPFYQSDQMAYIFSAGALKNFVKIATMLPVDVPGIYAGYKFHSTINGSLWTLAIEFSCYLILALALSINKTWKSPAILLTATILCVILVPATSKDTINWYGVVLKSFLQFSICFSIGSLMAFTEECWSRPKNRLKILAVTIIFFYATLRLQEIQVIGYATIAIVTIILSTMFTDRIIKGRFDISYGLYIFAFPVQQIISNETTLGFFPGMVLSIIITAILGYLSWEYVEKKFIKRSKSIPFKKTL